MEYSIDKIKLEFLYAKTNKVQDFLNSLSGADYSAYYESNKITKCKHNFKFGEGEGAIYLGIIPNWESECRYDKNIVLEYNPNKVNPFLISEFYWLKYFPRSCIKVMSFDVAVDMSVPYKSIRMLKRDVREYMASIGHSEVETRYLGELGHNHIKLYNKAKEQKIDNMDWSRFEITVKKINSFSCDLKEFKENIKLPVLYYVCSQMSLDEYEQLNDITRIVLESIIADVNVLYTIKRYETRKKYEKLLNKYLNPINIDIECMYNAFCDYFRECFENETKPNDIIDINCFA